MRGFAYGAILGVVVAGFLALAASPALANTPPTPTAVDPLLKDTAVTGSQVSTSGVVPDNGTILKDDQHLILVDDDKMQCPTAQFTSINLAVQFAAPGAVIRVCPGNYVTEATIAVDKPGLYIQAVRYSGTTCTCNVGTPNPSNEAIAQSFLVSADNVTIEGFTMVAAAVPFAFQLGGANDAVRHNVIDGSGGAMGVNLIGSGAQVTYNCMHDVSIGVEDDGASGSTIANNTIKDYATVGIDEFTVPPGTTVSPSQIQHNYLTTSSTAAIGIVMGQESSGNVTCNKVVGGDIGIVLSSAFATTVSYNVLANGLDFGIQINTPPDLAHTTISYNCIYGWGNTGIDLAALSTGFTIASNRVTSNGVTGMHAAAGSALNVIKNNTMVNNGLYDCADDDGGTVNTWTGNVGNTEFPPFSNICHRTS